MKTSGLGGLSNPAIKTQSFDKKKYALARKEKGRYIFILHRD